jgi:carboxymethylenebutenolidase
VALMGFCLGGSLAFLAAALAGSEDDAVAPDCVVSYYGSLVPDAIEDLEDIACPVLFHFGGADPFIPRRKVALVEEAAASRPDVEVHVQDSGGHAFDNHLAPQFHHAPSAKAAWDVTVAFLGRHLPVDGD